MDKKSKLKKLKSKDFTNKLTKHNSKTHFSTRSLSSISHHNLRINRDSGNSSFDINDVHNTDEIDLNLLKNEILEIKKESVVLCIGTLLNSMIHEKRRFYDRFVDQNIVENLTPNKSTAASAALSTSSPAVNKHSNKYFSSSHNSQTNLNSSKTIPINTDINVTSYNNVEYILYINNPESQDFQMYTSASHPKNIPHSHAQYQLKNPNNRKAKDRWQFLLDRESLSLSPNLMLDWLYGAIKASLQVIKAKYLWMSDVNLIDHRMTNGKIMINVGRSVLIKYREIVGKKDGVSEAAYNNLLNTQSNTICQVQINVCIPVNRSSEEISKLPLIAQEDVKNRNLFWILQSSGPINHKNNQLLDPPNFWKIRVFARTPGNLCKGVFTKNPHATEAIKLNFDRLKNFLTTLDSQIPNLYVSVSPMQIALSSILWHVDAKSENFYLTSSADQVYLDILNQIYSHFESLNLPDRFLPEMNLFLPLKNDVNVPLILKIIDTQRTQIRKIIEANEELTPKMPTPNRPNLELSRHKIKTISTSSNSSERTEYLEPNTKSRSNSTYNKYTVLQPTGGLKKLERKTSSTCAFQGTYDYEQKQKDVDSEINSGSSDHRDSGLAEDLDLNSPGGGAGNPANSGHNRRSRLSENSVDTKISQNSSNSKSCLLPNHSNEVFTTEDQNIIEKEIEDACRSAYMKKSNSSNTSSTLKISPAINNNNNTRVLPIKYQKNLPSPGSSGVTNYNDAFELNEDPTLPRVRKRLSQENSPPEKFDPTKVTYSKIIYGGTKTISYTSSEKAPIPRERIKSKPSNELRFSQSSIHWELLV